MTSRRVLIVPLVALGLLSCDQHGENAGDGTSVDAPKADNTRVAEDTCVHAKDGTCDEPVNCALGTDETDCLAACQSGTTPHLLGAACGYRTPPLQGVAFDVTVGSGGGLHLTGNRDGYIRVPSGENPHKMVDRHYRLYVPATYDPARPTPLLLHMPGHRVGLHILPPLIYLHHTADINRFILVYLEQEVRSDIRHAWWTDWDWVHRPKDNPDIYFLRQIIDKLEQDYNIDRTRIFATGQSRGAAMSIIAALEMSDVIAGASPQSGFTEFDYHQRVQAYRGRHTPMYFVHGVVDTDVEINCTMATCNIEASDALVKRLRSKGWSDNELVYLRLEQVGHAWQPQYNQQMWDFLSARPLPQ